MVKTALPSGSPRRPSSPRGTGRSGPGPSIGTLLRERRLYHRWTLSDVSRLTGISTSALSKIENDRVSLTYDNLTRISAGL